LREREKTRRKNAKYREITEWGRPRRAACGAIWDLGGRSDKPAAGRPVASAPQALHHKKVLFRVLSRSSFACFAF
jgi:hypothetical protein